MRCIGCGSEAVTGRPERTAQGYRRLRNFLRLRSRRNQHAARRRLLFVRRTMTVLAILKAA